MTAVTSLSPWAPIDLNQSGIRRLKLVDADSVSILSPNAELIPKADLVFYEFIFPKALACVASFQRQLNESGAAYWAVTLSFTLPHSTNQIMEWAAGNPNTEWFIIAEDYNDNVKAFGGSTGGLALTCQGTTGARPGDINPVSFNLTANQLVPYTSLASYENADLFTSGEFDYSFNFSFS